MNDSKKERIEGWIEGKKLPPWQVKIHPTNECNLNCRFCWRRYYGDREDEIKAEKILSIVKETCSMGVSQIVFSGGGEPTVKSGLIKKAGKITKNYPVEENIITNGTLFSEEMIKQMIKNEWSSVSFSIHGGKSSTDDFLRGKGGSFKKTIDNVRLFQKWKKKLGKNRPKITFQMIVTKHNYEEVVSLSKIAEILGVSIIHLRLVNESGSKKFSLNSKQAEVLKSEVQEVEEMFSDNKSPLIEYDFPLMNLENFIEEKYSNSEEGPDEKEGEIKGDKLLCSEPFTKLVILSDGTVHSCCAVAEAKFHSPNFDTKKVDNIKNKDLKEVWYGDVLNKLREKIKKMELPKSCRMWCPADLKYRQESGLNELDGW